MTGPPTPSQNTARRAKTAAVDVGSQALREIAHNRLDQLFEQAVSARLYGVVSVELMFENGRPTTVRRGLNGTDKSG